MSLSKPLPDVAQTPVEHFVTCRAKEVFIEENGKKVGTGKGKFEYFRKGTTDEDKGENIDVTSWFEEGVFVLDNNLYSVAGYNDTDKYRIQSNEVRGKDDDGNPIQAIIRVVGYPSEKGKKNFIIAKGTYNDIKEHVTSKDIGGSFTRCIYMMNRVGQLIHLQLHGNAMASWFDSIEKRSADIHKRWVVVKEWKGGKKGSNEFLIPQFAYAEEIKPDDLTKAMQHDTVVQAYLEKYMQRNAKASSTGNEQQGQELDGQQQKEKAPEFDTKNWRKYRDHEDQPFLGELPIAQILQLKASAESKGECEGIFYGCLGQAAYDYQQILKTGSWKDKENKDKIKLVDLTYKQLVATLEAVQKNAPGNNSKIYLEAAVESKEAEQGEPVDGDAEVVNETDDIPF